MTDERDQVAAKRTVVGKRDRERSSGGERCVNGVASGSDCAFARGSGLRLGSGDGVPMEGLDRCCGHRRHPRVINQLGPTNIPTM